MPQRIQRKRVKGWRMPPGAVYVGRPSDWGNPFRVGYALDLGPSLGTLDITETLAVELYAAWVFQRGLGRPDPRGARRPRPRVLVLQVGAVPRRLPHRTGQLVNQDPGRPTFLGLELTPTTAMRDGRQRVWQCAQCGLVAVQSNLAAGEMGACPACRHTTWWRQQLPIAGLSIPART